MLYPAELRGLMRRMIIGIAVVFRSWEQVFRRPRDGRFGGLLGYAQRMNLLFAIVLTAVFLPSQSEQADGGATGSVAVTPEFEVIVLGRAQDGGLPHLGCERSCCINARKSGRLETPACLGVRNLETGRMLLLEATPRIETQVALLHELTGASGRPRAPVDGILLTHAHIGHYAGLIQLGREVASTKSTPVWATPRFCGFLRTNGPWSQLVELDQIDLNEITPGTTDGVKKPVAFEPLPGLRVEAFRVPHRDEFSDTVAYKLHGPSKTVLFCPDVDRWDAHEGLLDTLLDGVDVAYVDATFYDGRELPGRNILEVPHPPMIRTMELLEAVGRETPGRVRFIHLNHTNPALNDLDLQDEIRGRGFPVAEVGERIAI